MTRWSQMTAVLRSVGAEYTRRASIGDSCAQIGDCVGSGKEMVAVVAVKVCGLGGGSVNRVRHSAALDVVTSGSCRSPGSTARE